MTEIKTRWIGKTGAERAAILAKIDADERLKKMAAKAHMTLPMLAVQYMHSLKPGTKVRTADLMDAIDMPSNTASAVLGRLVKKGVLKVTKTTIPGTRMTAVYYSLS
ncbi:MAG: hypothetical protein ORN28_06790 [Rhodoferax sp.]|nr:hypothetical protein [Rhodoferax sp.]